MKLQRKDVPAKPPPKGPGDKFFEDLLMGEIRTKLNFDNCNNTEEMSEDGSFIFEADDFSSSKGMFCDQLNPHTKGRIDLLTRPCIRQR